MFKPPLANDACEDALTYPCDLRKLAQRFFCAAAILFLASGLSTRFFLPVPVLEPSEDSDEEPALLGGLPTRRPIIDLTWLICSSNFCFCASRPCRAASSISLFGDAEVLAIFMLVTQPP